MNGSALDVAIVIVVVGLRFGIPLLIPRYPLPAEIAALVIDAADQTIFQKALTPDFWHSIEDGYQGYDKALDVFYLSMAYAATMRNWTNRTALAAAQFLWLYRLFGVTLFEVVHDPADPSSWRWLLLVFPNTFEYFFIAYEAIRLRWDPRRLSRRLVIGLVAFIWIVIKLPQEWWIHVARLDFTDFLRDHAWAGPVIAVFLLAVGVTAWWLVRYRLPGADHPVRIAADPLPEALDTAAERAAYRAAHWRLFDWNLVEKVALVSLVCVDFAQILPGTRATPLQVLLGVGVLVVVNSAIGLAFARRSWSVGNSALQFMLLVGMNLALVGIARALTPAFRPAHATFFVLLISLIVLLYDRYRPIRELRRAEADHDRRPIPARASEPAPEPPSAGQHGPGSRSGERDRRREAR